MSQTAAAPDPAKLAHWCESICARFAAVTDFPLLYDAMRVAGPYTNQIETHAPDLYGKIQAAFGSAVARLGNKPRRALP